MNCFEFWAAIVDSLAWPVAVTSAVLLLRSAISQTIIGIERLRLRYKGLELDFSKRVKKLEKKATPLPHIAVPSADKGEDVSGEHSTSDDDYAKAIVAQVDKLAQCAPATAVVTAWGAVELALLQAAQRILGTLDIWPEQALRRLRDLGYLTEDEFGPLDDMRQLRNHVAHAKAARISPDSARHFGEIAARGAIKILRLQKRS